MPLMTHPDSPEPFDTITDDQADVLRDLGWTEVEAGATTTSPRKRPAKKRAAKKTAATTTTAGGSKPAGTEKE